MIETNPTVAHVHKKFDIIVFSHLRWEFVYQRPQHIMSRLAKHYNILFVEEPVPAIQNKPFNKFSPIANLTVLQPAGISMAEVPQLLQQYLPAQQFAVGWFYSPAFIEACSVLKFDKIVYDCMDELTLFKGASPELKAQEETLLQRAAVVFTGGKMLYEAKKNRHPHVYCFPSSVDYNHFQKALNGIALPADMLINGPVVGYYGVIDERIDYDLLSDIAHLLPHISFVMIGPLAKVSADDLPRAANLHYLGMKSYASLPAYLKCIDVAMMPFALNHATKYISPTKTLEYMAAHKPIISTPIYDVIRDYGTLVEIVANAEGFAAVLNKILNRTPAEKEALAAGYTKVLAATSWDTTVQAMNGVLNQVAYEHAI